MPAVTTGVPVEHFERRAWSARSLDCSNNPPLASVSRSRLLTIPIRCADARSSTTSAGSIRDSTAFRLDEPTLIVRIRPDPMPAFGM